MRVRRYTSIELNIDKLSCDYLCKMADKLYEYRTEIPFTERQFETYISNCLNKFLIEEAANISNSIPKGINISIDELYIHRCGNIQVNRNFKEKKSFICMGDKENYIDVDYNYPLINL